MFSSQDDFQERHLGVSDLEVRQMLTVLGYESLAALVSDTLPDALKTEMTLALAEPRTESQLLAEIEAIASRNIRSKNYIGLGFSPVATPAVITRNILENPSWYTAYTPYQAELSQGRLEALLNFQQMIMDLSAFDVANASLLDEGSALGEAMTIAFNQHKKQRKKFLLTAGIYPQSLAVLKTRAAPLGIELVTGDYTQIDASFCGGVMQYPGADGEIPDLKAFSAGLHAVDALAITAADLMGLLLLPPPGECGIDIAVGSTQRFGLPLFYGGPHAAWIAAKGEFTRAVPGRFIGVTKDTRGKVAYRMALQTREQHIRRERATSNICTAQVLPAIMAVFYTIYHGPKRLRAKAESIMLHTSLLKEALQKLGYEIKNKSHFDTLTVCLSEEEKTEIVARSKHQKINFRVDSKDRIGISLNELTSVLDVQEIVTVFDASANFNWQRMKDKVVASMQNEKLRPQNFLTHPVFHLYQTETEFVRYANHLVSKDLSLTHTMIPLGSCTMKLNSAVELLPVSWPQFSDMHPFAPLEQTNGYQQLITELTQMLAEITGFPAVSLQPNAGSQGELAGLLAIREYHAERGEGQRRICLIPTSAHGTNPASAIMAGMKVVTVSCDRDGSIDMLDLTAKVNTYRDQLAALMITYPSTHGVFDENIVDVCRTVHEHGGQVYLDGANMNALVGLARPADFGADVLHLNLHKTFCIPHGGGGPGVGPVAAAEHLAPYLPSHPFLIPDGGGNPVASSPFGSAGILAISWAYLKLMGGAGLKKASQVAILNANYIVKRLAPHYRILFRGKNDLVAHECIVDCREFKSLGIDVSDIARRLMDYGFHSPTMSWPVAQTLMIEPTESESRAEIDRFCAAMISIRKEIKDIEQGGSPQLLTSAPHTIADCMTEDWQRPYSKQTAFYPLSYLENRKFWPPVNKIDQAFGDRNFVCACPPLVGDIAG